MKANADHDTLEEERGKNGKLTVFLGAADGVGKTSAMFEAALCQKKQKKNVVIGQLPGPYEKRARQVGVPVIPPLTFSNGSNRLIKPNVDKIIKAGPALAVIDELAGPNPPGSLRSKRYADVEAILKAGIDVYTTLNVFEIESLKNEVIKATGFHPAETVPDKFLERIRRIQVVDSCDAEWPNLNQMENIDSSGGAGTKGLYSSNHIMAMRELTFGYAAQNIDKVLDDGVPAGRAGGPWPVTGRVMVCVSGSPFSRELIRMAKQMAANMKVKWLAVYVDTPKTFSRSEQERIAVSRNLQLAEDLGAETYTITDSSVSEAILSFARQYKIKHVILGKPRYSKIWEWTHGAIVDKIIRNGEDLNIHVVPGHLDSPVSKINYLFAGDSIKWPPYFYITVIVGALTLLLRLTGLSFDLVNVALLYLLPVLFGATRWGIGPGFYAAFMSVLAFDFFFVPPVRSFTVADLRYMLSFAVFLVVALSTASLSLRLKQQLKESRQNEKIASTLYALSREMTVGEDLTVTLKQIVSQISDRIGFQVAVYFPDKQSELEILACSSDDGWEQSKANRAIAKWVYRNHEIAGCGTQTLSESSNLFLPLKTEDQIHGVMAIHYGTLRFPGTLEHKRLIEAIAGLVAVAIARIKFQEEAKTAHLMAESEKLRTILLDSLSHELRTPLSAIIGSVTALSDGDDIFSRDDRLQLLSTIRQGAVRMNRLVTNLLGMVRLESGMLHLNRQWCDLADIIGVAVKQIEDSLENRDLVIEMDELLSPVRVDEILIEQMLVNILSNAVKYSPDRSRITLSVYQMDDKIEIDIMDQGIGVPLKEIDHIFDKFYRVRTSSHVPGTGLGLAIAKGIVKAHGGEIDAAPNRDRGLTVSIILPSGKKDIEAVDPDEMR